MAETPKTDSSVAVQSAAAQSPPAQSPAPEADIARDMLRRSVFFVVPLIAAGAIGWGWAGTLSTALALALVLVNLALGAAAISLGTRGGPAALMAAVMGGYVLRLAIVTAAVLPIRHHDWFELLPFAVSLLVTHLGLLIVEMRHVSASLAFPGLKPRSGESSSLGIGS